MAAVDAVNMVLSRSRLGSAPRARASRCGFGCGAGRSLAGSGDYGAETAMRRAGMSRCRSFIIAHAFRGSPKAIGRGALLISAGAAAVNKIRHLAVLC
jgi:hypothetical protein